MEGDEHSTAAPTETLELLVKLFRSSTDRQRCNQLSSIASSLFFRLAEIVTENTQKYPPTQQFFSSCIDILGQEFIRFDPSQTKMVLAMALGKPSVAGFMAPHFMPSMSPQMFVPMYEKLMKTLQGGSPELTFMLLTKFDVSAWLGEYNPSKAEVKEFIKILGQAFMSCGAEPDKFHQQVLELYLGHERRLLSFKFPIYLYEVIAAVLQGSSVQKVNVACWEILHNSCFQMSSADSQEVKDAEMHVRTDLSTDQVRNLLLWFAHEFTEVRQNKHLTFGLYPKWQRYVPHLAAFLRDLSKCYVDKIVLSLHDAASNGGVDVLCGQIADAFSPWIQTVFIKGSVHVPWIETDKETGSMMVKALCDVVVYAHHRTAEIRSRFYNDFLSLLWLYFADGLCKPQVPNEVVGVYNLELAKLPWQQLLPSIQVMETMVGLKENGNSLGFNLVADIISLVNWSHVVQWYESYHPPEVKSEFERCLFLLFVQAFTEKKHVECPDMERVLVQGESFSWQYLTPHAFRSACSWLLQGCDPKCLLVERSSPDAIGLRILKSAACFSTQASSNWSDLVSQKRLNYLHCITSLLCQCTFLLDCDISAVEKVVINLLTEIETIESAIPDICKQQEESTDMMKEVLSLLNNSNPEGNISTVVMTAIIQWFHDSPQTILLTPCIHSASRCLASLSHLTQIVEECIQMYFVSAKQKNVTDPWGSVLAVLQFPELGLTEFFTACLQEGAYLLLYCYTLQRVPLCQNLAEEQGVIEVILDWTERAKPTTENESKLLLWWNKALALILRQIDYGRDAATCVYLVKKVAHKVQVFGEDRAHGGLLGAIGLGKKSALSEKFRLSCRALSTFCDCQVINENQLRLEATSPQSTFPGIKQEVAALLALKTNKKYQPIKTDVEMMCEFVMDQNKCIGNVLELIQLSKALFYTDKEFLSVM